MKKLGIVRPGREDDAAFTSPSIVGIPRQSLAS
jgi:hypothetical protein